MTATNDTSTPNKSTSRNPSLGASIPPNSLDNSRRHSQEVQVDSMVLVASTATTGPLLHSVQCDVDYHHCPNLEILLQDALDLSRVGMEVLVRANDDGGGAPVVLQQQ